MRSQKEEDTCEKLYNPLPAEVSGIDQGPVNRDSEKELKNFIEATVPKSDQKELNVELKKTLALRRTTSQFKKGAKETKKKKNKALTAKELRRLGLHRLPKRGLQYSEFHELHQLWLGYINELVDFERDNLNEDENVKMKLCRADYHGGFVTVTKTNNKSLAGISGYVLMESRNTFRIISPDNVVRIVPKNNSVFTFKVGDHSFAVHGKNMIMRPAERAVKKWKNKGPFEF